MSNKLPSWSSRCVCVRTLTRWFQTEKIIRSGHSTGWSRSSGERSRPSSGASPTRGTPASDVSVIGRNTQVVEDHRFEALNRHTTPFTVEIVDYRPIAQDDDIQMRVGPESTPPDEADFDDRPGVLAWRRELPPGETLTVRNAYTVVYPTNQILVGQ